MDRPNSGTIYLDGVQVQKLQGAKAADFRRDKVGFVFQLFYLLPNLTALENVMLPLLPTRRKLSFDLEERANHLLELVGLEKRLHHLPSRLSGGEQQRVAIARALINQPTVLLADEPTGNLDPHTGEEVLRILREIQQTECLTLVMITHDARISGQAERQLDLAQIQTISAKNK
jgi:ABC-type lipoprotein export system ATPase subunit